MKQKIEQLNKKFEGKLPEQVLQYFLIEYKGKIALSSSFKHRRSGINRYDREN